MRTLAALAVMGPLGILAAPVEVATYPAPAAEVLSSDFQVTAAGKPVSVYTARTLDPPFAGKEWNHGGPYAFASFDTSGSVEVRITSARSLRDTVIRPAGLGIKTRLDSDNVLVLSMPGPRKLSIEPDGKNGPLLLFANPTEDPPPRRGSDSVIYFGPGLHRPGRIEVADNQTLYLAGGAVVYGGVVAHGDNIRIAGRGILDSSDSAWEEGPTPEVVTVHGTNVEIGGITIRGASRWTIGLHDSRRVAVRNVKICGGRVQNDDGIDVCNSQDVLITDCFIRTDDDCVALKGLEFTAPDSNVERITVEDSTLWCDRARIFLLGHESRAKFMRSISLRNLDIIHFMMTPFLFQPGEEMVLEGVSVGDVRVHGEGQHELIRVEPTVNQYMFNKVPGHVQKTLFRDIRVEGKAGAYGVRLEGPDERHGVDDVTFENVDILGERLAAGSERLTVGRFVENVRFVAPGPGR